MIFGNMKDLKENEIKTFLYKGRSLPVVGTTIKWLSQEGEPALPEYGLRFVIVKPGGSIPIHRHEYAQTQVIISGKLVVEDYDNDDKLIEEKTLGPGDYFYVKPMEIHGMRNNGKENATFFCCICVLGD